jgi:hypothetical protein
MSVLTAYRAVRESPKDLTCVSPASHNAWHGRRRTAYFAARTTGSSIALSSPGA